MGAIGLFKALDLQVVDYQSGQDVLGVWDPATGQFRSGFPATVNDLQLLTGPAIADVDGNAGEEILSGSSSQDLVAYGADGTPASGWPKLTTDWTVATPLIGSFGTEDTDDGARKVVVGITRSGYVHAYATEAPACSPSSSPRFHHDNANSGDYARDAVLPGAPTALKAKGGELSFLAPGDDLLCGTADHYEMATAKSAIDEDVLRGREAARRGARAEGRGREAEARGPGQVEGLDRDPRGRRSGQRRPGGDGEGEGAAGGPKALQQRDPRDQARRPPARHRRR